MVRAQVVQSAERLAVGRSVDIDAFLLFLIENWREEAGRAEERLRALFVASDSDGDGNLDIDEFTQVILHAARALSALCALRPCYLICWHLCLSINCTLKACPLLYSF